MAPARRALACLLAGACLAAAAAVATTTKGETGANILAAAVASNGQLRSSRSLKQQFEVSRHQRLKENEELPLVWLDVAINGTRLGRIEIALFCRRAPRTAENFRLLCTGELGADANGRRYHFKGSPFYRIIYNFIDQTGAEANGIYGGEFHDDPGALKTKHTHAGLLSVAHHGPNTNGGHFSIMMGPQPHLDGKHGVFGEIVSGFEYAKQINELARGRRNNELLNSAQAMIVDAGQTRPGSIVATPEFRAIIDAEKRRVAWRSKQPPAELERLRKLWADEELPLVFFDIAIKGVYAGRMEFVLFLKDSPRAAENFRLLCTGEVDAPPGGKPLHYKGTNFYRIIKDFIDQGGVWAEGALGGLFLDDPGGLKLNHSSMGILSQANYAPHTNSGHFSIMMAPAMYLNNKTVVFGHMVDGHHIAYDINALSETALNKELKDSQDVQIIDSGELRRGSYWQTSEFKSIIEGERARIQAAKAQKARMR